MDWPFTVFRFFLCIFGDISTDVDIFFIIIPFNKRFVSIFLSFIEILKTGAHMTVEVSERMNKMKPTEYLYTNVLTGNVIEKV